MKILKKVKNLPSTPGVYLMKDSMNKVIYVGKSKNLKSRVSSYFQKSKSHSPKVLRLISNIKDFDYITTDTEFEAFILECNLIKRFKPYYNRLMKNTRSYCYIKMKLAENYPYLLLSIEYSKNSEDLYFGPFNSKNKAKKAIQGLKEYFKILCSNSSNVGSHCLNYSLGLCIGVCSNEIAKEEYLFIFNKIVTLLKGTDRSIINDLEYKMNSSSKKLDFENAIKYRDYLNAINYVINKTKIIDYIKENKNIAVIEYLNDEEFKLFLLKGNKILCSLKYNLNDYTLDKLSNALRDNMQLCFNISVNNEIDISPEELDESQIIYMYLQNKSDNIKHLIISEIGNVIDWTKESDIFIGSAVVDSSVAIFNAAKDFINESLKTNEVTVIGIEQPEVVD